MRIPIALALVLGFATSSDAVESESRPMSFASCISFIQTAASEFGVPPINIVETESYRMVRFVASDGSVLITCGEGKLILTRSEYAPGADGRVVRKSGEPAFEVQSRNHSVDMSGLTEKQQQRAKSVAYGLVRLEHGKTPTLIEKFDTPLACNEMLFSKYWEQSDTVGCRGLNANGEVIIQAN